MEILNYSLDIIFSVEIWLERTYDQIAGTTKAAIACYKIGKTKLGFGVITHQNEKR